MLPPHVSLMRSWLWCIDTRVMNRLCVSKLSGERNERGSAHAFISAIRKINSQYLKIIVGGNPGCELYIVFKNDAFFLAKWTLKGPRWWFIVPIDGFGYSTWHFFLGLYADLRFSENERGCKTDGGNQGRAGSHCSHSQQYLAFDIQLNPLDPLPRSLCQSPPCQQDK